MELINLRKKIDEIDNQLIVLLEQRLKLTKKVQEHKKNNKIPIDQPEREQQILNKIADNDIKKIYEKIFSVSKDQSLEFYTFGESHGKVIGVLVLNAPAGIKLDAVQPELDRRKPGQSSITTQRREEDKVEFLSGVLDGKTTGAPLCMLIHNKNYDPKAYEHDKFRPGSADYSYFKKFGQLDKLRFMSGRETAARVMAGAVAKKMLKDIKIYAYAEQVGEIRCEQEDLDFIEKNIVRTADPNKAKQMVALIQKTKEKGDSVGGIVKIIIKGVPAGIGNPHLEKLDAELAKALMSIGAVKSVEFGATKMFGSKNNDQMTSEGFLSNNAGGILGGISTGQDIIIRLKVKPTPSIAQEQKTIDKDGNDVNIKIDGRHDPCIIPRLIPVAESMVAITLAKMIR